MRAIVLLGILLCAMSSARASVIVCSGSIIQEWGYLTILTSSGFECIVTRRVGLETGLGIGGDKHGKVTGVNSDQEGSYQYIQGLIGVEIDTQWKTPEAERLGDPTFWEAADAP